MANRTTSGFYAALESDARLAAAIGNLPAASLTGERPAAERAARAAALAAACRALRCMLRDLLAWPRDERTRRSDILAAPRA